MARFTILRKQLTDAEVEALRALIDQAGCADGEIAVAESVAPPDPETEDDVIVLLGTPAMCESSTLEDDLAKAAGGVQRAIWVWPDAAEATELPSPVAKYSYSCIPWNADKLRAIVEHDTPCFETATGTTVPKVPTERNMCVDEPAKEKAKAK